MSSVLRGPVAAIDCGTNSTRLLVVGPDGEPLTRLMWITRLGQGVDATQRLDAEAVERTVAVLSEFREEMERLEVVGGRLAATSAVRDAENGQAFLDTASAITGLRAEVLSGQEEGQLAFSGATAGLPPIVGTDLVIDIGGGSTELVLGHPGRVSVVSLDMGCVRLTERCLPNDPPKPNDLDAATTVVDRELDHALRELPELRSLPRPARLIGLAGTVATLASLDQGLEEYDRERIHGWALQREAVARWCRTLGAERAARRARRPGMVPGREDVILGGVLILTRVMTSLDFEECVVSESDILDGLVMAELADL